MLRGIGVDHVGDGLGALWGVVIDVGGIGLGAPGVRLGVMGHLTRRWSGCYGTEVGWVLGQGLATWDQPGAVEDGNAQTPTVPTTVPTNIATLFPQPPAITLQRQVPPASSWPPRASHLTSSWPASSEGEGGGHPRVQGPPQPAPSTHQLGCTCHLAGWGRPHSPGHTYAWVGDR